jgi:hypothetical protein
MIECDNISKYQDLKSINIVSERDINNGTYKYKLIKYSGECLVHKRVHKKCKTL